MTTGRINQVAARALRRGTATPLQLGKAHESRPLVSFTIGENFPSAEDQNFAVTEPLRHVFQFSLCTLNVPTRVCTRWGKFPVAHALLIRSILGGSSLPLRLKLTLATIWILPRLAARTCPAQFAKHGVCLRARARTCACSCGRVDRQSAFAVSLISIPTSPSYMFQHFEFPIMYNIRLNKTIKFS